MRPGGLQNGPDSLTSRAPHACLPGMEEFHVTRREMSVIPSLHRRTAARQGVANRGLTLLWRVLLISALAPGLQLSADVIPTMQSIFVYDSAGATTFRGAPAPVGAVIDAYDPDGVHCGTVTVGDRGLPAGFFAAMAVYVDDPNTRDLDEGARSGDEIAFRINGFSAQVTRNGPVIWTGNGATYDVSISVPYVGLEFSPQPGGSISGQPLTTPPVVRAMYGSSVDGSVGDVFTLSLASGAGTLSGTLTTTAVGGVASFGNVIYSAAVDGESFTLKVDDQAGVGGDYPSATSTPLASDVVASQLVFTTQPAGPTNNVPLLTQPVVEARDAASLRDLDFSETVTLSATAVTGAGTLSGDVDVVAVAGTATFTTVQYNVVSDGDTFTLIADDVDGVGTNLPPSASETIAGHIRWLVFEQQPGGSVSGQPLATQPIVHGDLAGVEPTYTGDVTLTLESGPGVLSGTLTVPAVAGVARFTDVAYTATVDGEPFSLRAVDGTGDFTAVVSSSTASDVVATQLVFTAQPAGSVSGIPLTVQPMVRATDAASTLDTDFTDQVDLSLASGPGSLFGSLSRAASAGEATWTDIGYTAAADGEPFSVRAAAAGLSRTSALVTSDVVATRLAFTTQPAGSVSGVALTVQPEVTAVDANSTTDVDVTGPFALSENFGSGALFGTLSQNASAGVATWTDIGYAATADRQAFRLQVESAGLTPAQIFLTSDVVATHLVFTTPPAGAVNAIPLLTQPVVEARDGASLKDIDFTETVALTATAVTGAGALSGDVDVAAVAGVASFSTVQYDVRTDGDTFTLAANDEDGVGDDLAPATSAAIAGRIRRLAFQAQPGGSVSGLPLTMPLVVRAEVGGVDPTYTGNVTLTLGSGSGSLSGTLTVPAIAGVARFTNVVYSATVDGESFTLRATDGTGRFASVVSTATTSDVVANHLAFTTPPAGAVNHTPLLTQPVVEARDERSVRDVDFTETVTLAAATVSGSGVLSGDVDVVAVAGVATFTTVRYDVSADGDRFSLSANDEDGVGTDLLPATSGPVTGRVRQLVFQAQPGGSVSGLPLMMPLVVRAEIGRVDGAYTGDVTLSLHDGSGDLSGTLTVSAAAGVARFTNVVYTATADGESFSLRATDDGGSFAAAVSRPTTSDVVATRLVFTTQPAGTVNGVPMLTQPVVEAQDAASVRDVNFTETVTLTSAPVTGGGTLSGDVDVVAVAGVATFTTVQYDVASDGDTFALTATDDGGVGADLSPATSEIIGGRIRQLAFRTQPGGSVSGLPLAIQPVVIADLGGIDRAYTGNVTLSLESGAGFLSGTLTAPAIAGVARFADIAYTATVDGEAFTLRAVDDDGDFTAAASSTTTSDVVATQLAFTTQPAGAANGVPMLIQPVVEARDASSLRDTDFTGTVTLASAPVTGGGTLSGDVSVVAVAGVATFATVQYDVDANGDEFALVADDEGGAGPDLPAATSDTIAGSIGRLVFQTQPGGSTSGLPLATQPIVVADLEGVDPTYVGNVTLSLESGTGILSGTLTVPASAGVARFADVAYTATVDGEDFALRAQAGDGDFAAGVSSTTTSDVQATRLAFTGLPDTAHTGDPMVPPPQVTALDPNGLADEDFSETVTLRLGAGPGALSGTLSKASSNGVSTFSDVVYTATGALDHFSLVADDESTGDTDLLSITSPLLVARGLLRVEIPLAMGYNLVSWNVDAANDSIAHICAPILDNLIQVLGFETPLVNPNAPGTGGKLYSPALPLSVNTLKLTDHRQGYWFQMRSPDMLIVEGAELDPRTTIPLAAGYNLVPYLPAPRDLTRHGIESILPNLAHVLGFETVASNPNGSGTGGKLFDPSLPSHVNTLQVMSPNLAYWVKLRRPDTLGYPAAADPATPTQTPGPSVDGRVYPTNQWMGIHGQLTTYDEPAPPGTVVDVVDAAGNIAGWSQVHHAGAYGYLPIYLDDPETERDEGAHEGEWLIVRVNGRPIGYRVQWTGFGDVEKLDMWLEVPTAVSPTMLPHVFALRQNYPNPFNVGTTVSYELAREEAVSLSIYNLSGQVIRRLVREVQGQGPHSVLWDGRDDALNRVTSGCYLYRLQAGPFEQTRKLLLLK